MMKRPRPVHSILCDCDDCLQGLRLEDAPEPAEVEPPEPRELTAREEDAVADGYVADLRARIGLRYER